jgi:hypothetical protein
VRKRFAQSHLALGNEQLLPGCLGVIVRDDLGVWRMRCIVRSCAAHRMRPHSRRVVVAS